MAENHITRERVHSGCSIIQFSINVLYCALQHKGSLQIKDEKPLSLKCVYTDKISLDSPDRKLESITSKTSHPIITISQLYMKFMSNACT